MKAITPRTSQTTCPDCGWRSKLTTAALAAHALQIHQDPNSRGCENHTTRAATAARYENRMAQIDRTPKPCLHKQAQHQHGTRLGYTLDRCRCLPCCAAVGAYEQNRVRQQAYGRWAGLVDAEPSRQRVRELQAAGWGLKQIVKASGLSHGLMTKLMYGCGDRPPARRVRPATEASILALHVPTVDQLAAGAIVSSIGTTRRVQALMHRGWSISRLAYEAGIDPQPLYHSLRTDNCLARTHLTVVALYDRLWDKQPPETTKHERISASRTRRRARDEGWVPPLAWDDDAIDNPELTTTERHTKARRLLAGGTPVKTVTRLAHLDRITVNRIRDELGLAS